MAALCKRIADSSFFQNFIIAVILVAGIVVGLETYESIRLEHEALLAAIDITILAIFCAEILIKLIAQWPRPHQFFMDPWNIFDFVIVVACLMPFNSQYITVLRLLRLLRVLRIVRAVPKLQLIVTALLKSIPSMFYVSLLLGLFFYVYAVAATFLFGANDPIHFRSLEYSLLSLFRVVTLEDWTDVMYINMFGCNNYGYDGMQDMCQNPKAMPLVSALFFVSFVLLGTMVILNLFIGVIMNGMDEANREVQAQLKTDQRDHERVMTEEIAGVHTQLDLLLERVSTLKAMATITEKK